MRKGFVPLLLLFSALTIGPQAQSGFQLDPQYVTGLGSPTAMAFAPDGRLFVTEQGGSVRIITPAGQLLSTPFLTVSVRSDEERGLLGLAFHPQFPSNGYLYIFYTPSNAAVTRISRVTASGDRAATGSEITIFEYGNFSGNHRGGDIHFGPDGKLYIALGDAGEPLNAQSATSFDGKILRLNSDGTVPPDNPASFVTTSGTRVTPAGQYRAIWAMGLRNPYRFSFHRVTGSMRINDVGAGAWEEVNVGQAGVNYGWPTCEGLCSNANARNPIYVHERGIDGCAITGGAFQTGSQFPAAYADNYFLIDYCATWMRHLRTDNTVATFPLAVPQFSVDLKSAPDGSLLVLGHGSGTISRITYAGTANRLPIAQGTASPTSGPAPLTVNFSAAGSSDPDGDALTYAWQFGDGTTGSGISVTHTFTASGAYTTRLTVSDGRGGTASRDFSISVGSGPSATIAQPTADRLYTAGDTITFSGAATDPEDGQLPASAFRWTVLFHHDAHTHPALGPLTGTTSGSFTIPTTGHPEDNVFYRIYLTVTDSAGLQTQVTRDVMPHKARITVTSTVAGAQVLLDGQPQTTPYSFTSVAGVQRTIGVVSPQVLGGQSYVFSAWSDGGAESHTISGPGSDTTYTATLRADTSTPPPAPAPFARWKFDNDLTESVRGINTAGRGTITYRSDDRAPVSANLASVSFDGASGTYISIAGDLPLNNWSAATASLWINVSTATATGWPIGSDHTLLFKTGAVHARIRKVAAGDLRLAVSHGDGAALGTPVVSTASIPTDVWVNLATVHQGTTVTMYIASQAGGSGSTGRTFGGPNSETLDIVGYGGNFNGLADDIRLFDQALSAAQVSTLGGSGPPAPPTGLRIIR